MMEYHRLLYKGKGSVLSPKDAKRKTAHEARAAKRNELYSSTRYMSLSPSPKRNEHSPEAKKENVEPFHTVSPLKPNEVLFSKEPQNNTNFAPKRIEEKISRQKVHLMRYLAWKAEKNKQAQLKEQSQKRAPFVVPTKGMFDPPPLKKSFAPKNYAFSPPSNLKDLRVEVVGINSIRCINGTEQATYHFVETPKKKNNLQIKPVQTRSTQAKRLPASQFVTPKLQIPKTSTCLLKTTSNPTAPCSTEIKHKIPPSNIRKTATAPKQIPRNPTSQKLSPAETEIKLPKTPVGPKLKRPPTQPVQKMSLKPIEKPKRTIPLGVKINQVVQKTSTVNSKPQASTITNARIKKSGLPPLKRPTFKAPKKTTSSISSAATLGMSRNTRSKTTSVPGIILNTKTLLQNMGGICDLLPDIPTETNFVNSFMNCLTSTKRKSSSGVLAQVDLVNVISPIDDCSSKSAFKPKNDEKFNFVRYSFVKPDSDKSAKKNEEPENTKLENGEGVDYVKTTPEKTTAPTNYMSPYVSVARGKVNTKTEREKRNSVYMVADDSIAENPEKTASMRHTLATISYYRKQLMDEISRLNNQCDSWERYKESNPQLIQDCGEDMIVVTIGQTRLLTSKKLKQFSGLIDRCENGVLGMISNSSDGSEGTKPILPEDLEGFWSMVSLQIENVDKRFAELERWKANNWTDPDDVPTKTNKNVPNVKKTKKRKPVTTARPNGALQKMLKNAHAAYLNKKATGAVDEDVILTPSQTRQVLIRDRRSRSAAATVITVNTPRTNHRKSATESVDLNETPKLLPHINGFRKSLNLLKSTLQSRQDRESEQKEYGSPYRQNIISRKSILKTPGSVCKPKTVLFNSPPLKFTIDDSVDEAKSMSKNDNDEEQRIYKLRNRRIVLRDSSEFEVPK